MRSILLGALLFLFGCSTVSADNKWHSQRRELVLYEAKCCDACRWYDLVCQYVACKQCSEVIVGSESTNPSGSNNNTNTSAVLHKLRDFHERTCEKCDGWEWVCRLIACSPTSAPLAADDSTPSEAKEVI